MIKYPQHFICHYHEREREREKETLKSIEIHASTFDITYIDFFFLALVKKNPLYIMTFDKNF